MTLEYELENIDPDRANQAVTAFYEQVHDGRFATTFTENIEQKYPGLTSLIDDLQSRLISDGASGEISPVVAKALAVGVRIGFTALIEYAEADGLDQAFKDH